MKLSDQVKRQATEFVNLKGQKILHGRKIPPAEIGSAWIIVNDMESGFLPDGVAAIKLGALKKVKSLDPDLEAFWNSNEEEFETILATENI